MARSSIHRLPAELRKEIDRLLADGRFTIREVQAVYETILGRERKCGNVITEMIFIRLRHSTGIKCGQKDGSRRCRNRK